MNYLATFSGDKYFATTKRIVEDSPRFGVDQVLVYDDIWLRNCRPGFWEKTKYFREHPNRRGVDWFCFKPFYIWDAFCRMNDGDVLLAVDADTYPIADLTPLYRRCVEDGGKMFFNCLGCPNRHWTKRDVFLLMGCDEPKYHDAYQACARFMLLAKGGAFPVEKFLGEWLGFTCNPIINTFDASVMGQPDYEGFRENRCEQSVLGGLTVKYGCKLYREACGNGNGGTEDWDVYPQCFIQSGDHTYHPTEATEGSSFRNVND